MSVDATAAQAIEKTREAHVAALNRGDVAAWAAAFADDGVQMPPNFPANVGRGNIHAWSGAFLVLSAPSSRSLQKRFRSLVPTGHLNAVPTASGSLPRPEASRFKDAGKYITVYQRQPDDSWAMARDIWNSNNPLPGMPE